MRYQDVFKRYEKKYLLNRQQYVSICHALQGMMQEDVYGEHTICNLYFDTEHDDMIRHSLNKPVYKEKLRLRSYGVPGVQDPVYVEIKKKVDGIVYKRRVQMKLSEAYRYLLAGIRPAEESQIIAEVDWLMKQRRPAPRVFIGNDRIALAGIADPELRVTFDQNIRWREKPLDLMQGDEGAPVYTQDFILMELKLKDAMPLWMSRILANHKVYPASFSKYGACYEEHLCVGHKAKGGVICA